MPDRVRGRKGALQKQILEEIIGKIPEETLLQKLGTGLIVTQMQNRAQGGKGGTEKTWTPFFSLVNHGT